MKAAMPDIELATAFNISLSFIELKALQKSNCKIPEELDEVFFLRKLSQMYV